jgi:hypothetical protein
MRGFDNKALFRTPVSFNKPCPLCNEDFMACDREGCWRFPGIKTTAKRKSKSSVVVYVIGSVILVCIGTGIYLGVRYGY